MTRLLSFVLALAAGMASAQDQGTGQPSDCGEAPKCEMPPPCRLSLSDDPATATSESKTASLNDYRYCLSQRERAKVACDRAKTNYDICMVGNGAAKSHDDVAPARSRKLPRSRRDEPEQQRTQGDEPKQHGMRGEEPEQQQMGRDEPERQ